MRGVFRKRWERSTQSRRLPVSLYPAPEAAPAVDTGGSYISVNSLARPSFATGYARSAAESASPNLFRGLVAAYLPILGNTGATWPDLIGGNDGTMTNALTDWGVSQYGPVVNFLSSDKVTTPTSSVWDISNMTAVILARPSTIGNTDTLLTKGNPASWQQVWDLQFIFTAGAWQYADSSGRRVRTDANTDWEADKWTVGAVRVRNDTVAATDVQLFTAGVETAYDIQDDGSTHTDDTTHSLVIGSRGDGNRQFEGDIAGVLYYQRLLTDNEIKTLTDDFVAPFRRRIHIPLVTQEPPPAADTGGSYISVKSHVKPSYTNSYARNASESANPNLWDKIWFAYAPVLGGGANDLVDVTRQQPSIDMAAVKTTTTLGVNKFGPYAGYTGATGTSTAMTAGVLGECTCMFVGKTGDADNTAVAMIQVDYGTGAGDFELLFNASGFGTHTIGVRWKDSTNLAATASGYTNTHVVVIARRSGTTSDWTVDVFVNGVLDGTETSIAENPAGGTPPYSLITSERDTCEETNLFAMWQRALSDDEIRLLYADPLATFRRKLQIPLATQAAAPVGTSLQLGLHAIEYGLAGSALGLHGIGTGRV